MAEQLYFPGLLGSLRKHMQLLPSSMHMRLALPQVPIDLSAHWRPVRAEGLPAVFTGGWVGYTGYDTVRYVYSGGLRAAAVSAWLVVEVGWVWIQLPVFPWLPARVSQRLPRAICSCSRRPHCPLLPMLPRRQAAF